MANENLVNKDSNEHRHQPKRIRRINDEWEPEHVIQFLKQIVKETEKYHDSPVAIPVEYFNRNDLRLVSDNCLPFLFRDKYMLSIKVHELVVTPPESEDSNNSREKKNEDETKTAGKRKAVEAAAPPENIKLVYLKRCMVEELLMDAATFESNVVGSYVRIKYDSSDIVRGNSHMLLQVTGIRKAPECGDVDAEYFLQVPHLIKEIPISMLSNEDFTMEAIEDICVQHLQTGDSAKLYPISEAKLDYEVFQGHKNSRIHGASSSQNILYESDNNVNSGSSHYNFVARSSQYDNKDLRCYNEYHQRFDAEIKEMKDRMKAMQNMIDQLLVRKTN